jgi:hypothetical protein
MNYRITENPLSIKSLLNKKKEGNEMENSNFLEKILSSCTDGDKIKQDVVEYLFQYRYRTVMQKHLIELQDLDKVNVFSEIEFYNIFVQFLNNDNSIAIEDNCYLSLDEVGKNYLRNILSVDIGSNDNEFVMRFSNIFKEIVFKEFSNSLNLELSPQLRISDFYEMDQDYLKSSLSFFNELAQLKNITIVVSGTYTKTLFFNDFDGLLSETIEEATKFIENYGQASKNFQNIKFEVFDIFVKFWEKYISFLKRNPIDGEGDNPYQSKHLEDYWNSQQEGDDYFYNY